MTFTQWFQSWGGEAFGWFLATTVLILMIALPLIVYWPLHRLMSRRPQGK